MLHKQIDLAIAEREAWVQRRQRGIPSNQKLLVITCMDERLAVEEILGLQPGDAQIFRNAGGLATDDAVRTAVLCTNFFGAQEIIVLNHTHCGMTTATSEFVARVLQAKYDLDVPGLGLDPMTSSLSQFNAAFAKWFGMFDNVDETCQQQVQILRHHPLIPSEVKIHGYIYQMESGQLRKPFQLADQENAAELNLQEELRPSRQEFRI